MTEVNAEYEVGGKDAKWWRDAGERIFWTTAEVALGGAVVAVADLEGWYVIPIAAGLASLKAYVAKHVGDKTARLGASDVTNP